MNNLNNFSGKLIVHPNRTEHYNNGQLHREDGPAVYDTAGLEEWWINGNRVGAWKLPNSLEELDRLEKAQRNEENINSISIPPSIGREINPSRTLMDYLIGFLLTVYFLFIFFPYMFVAGTIERLRSANISGNKLTNSVKTGREKSP